MKITFAHLQKNSLIILLWILILVISFYFYFKSIAPYIYGNLEARKVAEKPWLIVHFLSAACTLFLGPLQFWPFFRERFKKWHRVSGRFYIVGSVISATTVFFILLNYPLPGSIPSLALLAIIWIFTTVTAFYFAIKKNFKQHKHFMIRSYVCGLAFIFIRLLPMIDDYTGFFGFMQNEEVRFTVYEWICWVYPLLITEFILVWYPLVKKQMTSKG